jgi:hypothetical protein
VNEAALIALVRKAIGLHKTTGCLEYFDLELQKRIRRELGNIGTPDSIKRLLVNHSTGGGKIDFKVEDREERQDRREFWFRALVPVAAHARPLFYELELLDDDPDVPAVVILNVHP